LSCKCHPATFQIAPQDEIARIGASNSCFRQASK
jgi:hypothetical protein